MPFIKMTTCNSVYVFLLKFYLFLSKSQIIYAIQVSKSLLLKVSVHSFFVLNHQLSFKK